MCLERKKQFKRGAVPEYIWYISMIVIALSLVFTIMSLTKKAKKNPNLPDIKEVDMSLYITPIGKLYLSDVTINGLKLEEAKQLYLRCAENISNTYNILEFTGVNNLKQILAYDQNNYIVSLKDIEINISKLNISDNCLKENAQWNLFYGNPDEGGFSLGKFFVSRKLMFNR